MLIATMALHLVDRHNRSAVHTLPGPTREPATGFATCLASREGQQRRLAAGKVESAVHRNSQVCPIILGSTSGNSKCGCKSAERISKFNCAPFDSSNPLPIISLPCWRWSSIIGHSTLARP